MRNLFLKLIRLGVNISDDTNLQAGIDWHAIQALAEHQGLSAIVVDGIDKLSVNTRPPKTQLLPWIGQVMREEQRYAIQRKASSELSLLLSKEGTRTYVLKGEMVAECYPRPEHRCSVDLDCFLKSISGNDDVWEAGNAIVEQAGYRVERDFYKNSTWFLPGLTVENHRWLTPFRGNKRLAALEKLLQSLLKEDEGTDVIEGTQLCRPPIMVSSLFLIEHAYSHFLHEGLTWRHVLDWIMFSRKHKGEIDWKQLNAWIDEFGFRRFYDSFVRLGQYLLGEVSESELTKKEHMMLDDVWAELDLHESVRGIGGKLALVGNTWRARWKYREFTEISWLQALCIQVKGFLFMKEPKLS